MPVLVVGSLGLDTLTTPFGQVKEVLGGTTSYFALAASMYTDVQVVAVVGTDFPEEYRRVLDGRRIDLQGIQVREGKTFRWSGEYRFDMNLAQTLDTQLNVFADFHPRLPEEYRSTRYVFLANIHPALQLEVVSQVHRPKLVVMDSMNFWIEHSKASLTEVMRRSDVVLLNDAEVRQFAETPNLISGARHILSLGPRAVVVKKGEHGALLVSKEDGVFVAPAYPQEEVRDPTGAGDSFAGGVIGYLASRDDVSPQAMRRAIIHGCAVASFTVEDFSVRRLERLSSSEVRERYTLFRNLTQFTDEELGVGISQPPTPKS
ncbi:MAG: sugar kinase [Chloroflexi bacterium]|nr:sugar kinase [Chloroflexota bacterium]